MTKCLKFASEFRKVGGCECIEHKDYDLYNLDECYTNPHAIIKDVFDQISNECAVYVLEECEKGEN